jgi:hypothetical protein
VHRIRTWTAQKHGSGAQGWPGSGWWRRLARSELTLESGEFNRSFDVLVRTCATSPPCCTIQALLELRPISLVIAGAALIHVVQGGDPSTAFQLTVPSLSDPGSPD